QRGKKTSNNSSDRILQDSHSIGRKRLKAIEIKSTLAIIGLASSGKTNINIVVSLARKETTIKQVNI
ncbi:MAG: hypothetical protein ACK559_15015, partial [bacterium]